MGFPTPWTVKIGPLPPVGVWQLGEAIELSADRGAAPPPYLACSTVLLASMPALHSYY